MLMVCIVDRCAEEGSQLKLTEVAQSPLVKQNLDTNVTVFTCIHVVLTNLTVDNCMWLQIVVQCYRCNRKCAEAFCNSRFISPCVSVESLFVSYFLHKMQ